MLDYLQNLWLSIKTMDRDAPMAWPFWLRQLTYATVCVAVVGLLWLSNLSADYQALKLAEVAHDRLRAEFSAKLMRAAPLPNLQSQQLLLQQHLTSLEKQLPGSLELDMLLSDMSRAGRDRHLRFELLRPAELKTQPAYAQQRIALRVVGRYQDIASFAADLSKLTWWVSIQSFTLLPAEDGVLVMDAVVRTLRPLDMVPSQTAKKDAS
jgi:type IV pilus assembly protein PilO